MIVALWHRWTQSGNARWIFLAGALLMLDVVLGSWLIALEIRWVKGAW